MIFYDGNLLKNVVFQHGNDRKFKKRVTISLQKCDLFSYDMVLKIVTQFSGNVTQLLKIFSKFMIGKLYDKNVLWILIGDQVSQKCDMFSRNRVTFSKNNLWKTGHNFKKHFWLEIPNSAEMVILRHIVSLTICLRVNIR